MSTLHESVIVRTPTGDIEGELYVGKDGLPELEYYTPGANKVTTWGGFSPATFPAAWRVLTVSPYQGVLYDTWVALTTLREVIAMAQREAESETPEPEDDITAYKRARDAEARGER